MLSGRLTAFARGTGAGTARNVPLGTGGDTKLGFESEDAFFERLLLRPGLGCHRLDCVELFATN